MLKLCILENHNANMYVLSAIYLYCHISKFPGGRVPQSGPGSPHLSMINITMMCPLQISHQRVMTFVAQGLFLTFNFKSAARDLCDWPITCPKPSGMTPSPPITILLLFVGANRCHIMNAFTLIFFLKKYIMLDSDPDYRPKTKE